MAWRAAASDENCVSFNSSSRNRPRVRSWRQAERARAPAYGSKDPHSDDSVPASLNDHSLNHLFAQRFTSFQAMEPLNKDKSVAIEAKENWALLTIFQNALGNVGQYLHVESLAPLYRHVYLLETDKHNFHGAAFGLGEN
jgi:hypothetical protein